MRSINHVYLLASLLVPAACMVQMPPTPATFDFVRRSSGGAPPFNMSGGGGVAWPFTTKYKIDINQWFTNTNAYPALLVYPANVADVIAAVNYAILKGRKVSVKATGADWAGRSSGDSTVNIIMRRMRRVTYDPATTTVSLQGGATWGDVQRVLDQNGRVAVGPLAHTLSPVGCLATGCWGPLSRQYGLGVDNVVSYILVTPEAQLVRVSSEGVHQMSLQPDGTVSSVRGKQLAKDPTLFWALRGGGGGTWGVVVRVTLKTHPQPALVQHRTLRILLEDTKKKIAPGLTLLSTTILNSTWWQDMPPEVSLAAFVMVPSENSAYANFTYVGAPTGDDAGAEGGLDATPVAALTDGSLVGVWNADDKNPTDTFPSLYEMGNTYTSWLTKGDVVYRRMAGAGNVLVPAGSVEYVADTLWNAAMYYRTPSGPAGDDPPVSSVITISCQLGGAVTKHPESAKTSVAPWLRQSMCQVQSSALTNNPAWDAAVAGMHWNILDPLWKLLPAACQAEMVWQPGTGVQPVWDWYSRFWGENYGRLLAAKRANDPSNTMASGVYSVDWTGAS